MSAGPDPPVLASTWIEMRILGLAAGDPDNALSGVAGHLLRALGRRAEVVGCLNYGPRGLTRLALAAATVRPERAQWRARFHTSLTAHRVHSKSLATRVRSATQPFDIALQVHGWVIGQPRPYVLYVDQTRLMAERGWPAWMPMTARERRRILQRECLMYEQAAHILVMGEPARESLMTDYSVDAHRITVVGGGLMFNAPPVPSGPAAAPVITFVGREFARKGGHTLLEAFAHVRLEIPRAQLQIVGVQRAVTQPGVSYLGRLRSREEMSEIYRQTRVFCMPSRYEPYGFVFSEAMAHGVPCVGTTVQSIPEILDYGRAGVLVAPDDAEGLGAALIRLLSDERAARDLGEAGRRNVEHRLLWDHVAARAIPALERAVTTS